MALFKTVTEIKAFLPVSTTFNFQDILPFLNQVERDYIIPVIGKEQYDAIHAPYQAATSMTAAETALLAKIRVPLSHFAFMLWIPFGQTTIDSSGIRIIHTENLKTAFPWQIEDLKGSANRSGYSGIEEMLEFMETNKVDYGLWKASTAYTDFKKHFIKSAKEFQEFFNIRSSRLTYLSMLPIMNRLEETLIKKIIGKTKFDEIKAELKAGSVSTDNQELVDIIRPAVANLTMSRAVSELAIKIDEFGISIITSAQEVKMHSKAPNNHLSKLESQTQIDGEYFLKSLEDKVNENDEDYNDGPMENDDCWGAGGFM